INVVGCQVRCLNLADTGYMGKDTNAGLCKKTFCYSPCRNAGCGFPCRGTPPTAVVADAILYLIGIVCVRGTVFVSDMRMILRTLVFIGNDHCQRCAGRFALKYTRQDFGGIAFLPLRGNLGLTWAALVQFGLDKRLVDGDIGWAPIDNDTNCLTV